MHPSKLYTNQVTHRWQGSYNIIVCTGKNLQERWTPDAETSATKLYNAAISSLAELEL